MSVDLACGRMVSSPESSLGLIEMFWRREVCPFKFCHGTSSLYRAHFEKNGLSATYPEEFKRIIDKTRVVWNCHLDVCEKRYFGDFEDRYDKACRTGEVRMSFTAKPDIIEEFTKGERKGGEWLREMKRFISYANKRLDLFSVSEKVVIQEMECFIRDINEFPQMIVKVSAGSAFWTPLLCPLQFFTQYVQGNCSSWENPAALSDYLEIELQSELTEHKQYIANDYEATLSQKISPELLEFEILADSAVFLKLLKFGEQVKVSAAEVGELKIKRDGTSDNPNYRDSRFEYASAPDDCYLITRMPL